MCRKQIFFCLLPLLFILTFSCRYNNWYLLRNSFSISDLFFIVFLRSYQCCLKQYFVTFRQIINQESKNRFEEGKIEEKGKSGIIGDGTSSEIIYKYWIAIKCLLVCSLHKGHVLDAEQRLEWLQQQRIDLAWKENKEKSIQTIVTTLEICFINSFLFSG